MSDSFFSKPSASKRKRPSTGGAPASKGKGGGASTTSSARPGAKGRPSAAGASTSSSSKNKKRDEELSDGGSDVGVEDMDLRRDTRGGESDDEERVRAGRETGGEKRLRMAREYLEGLEKEQDDGTYDAAEIDRDIMASRLQSDVLSHSPKIHIFLSDFLSSANTNTYFLPLPNLPPTAARASPETPYLYTSSKSGALSKYSLHTGELLAHWPRLARPTKEEKKGKGKAAGKATGGWSVEGRDLKGHTGEVLDLAVSEDGKWVATAGREGVVGCWDVEGETGKWVRGLRGHRDAVTSLAFQSQSLTLYTTSLDRTISVFSLSTLSHLETLFGHQDSTHSLSTLRAENLVSAGSRDRTVRFWKIPEESQLVFRGGGGSKGVWAEDDDIEEEKERQDRLAGKEGEGPSKIERRRKRLGKQKDAYKEGSIDCVAMVDEQHFLSGGDSGAIALWTITKKKPVFINHLSHGLNEHASESEGVIGTARWITSLACLPYGDTFVSGSWDGQIRVWALSPSLKSFSPLFTIPAPGFINSLQLLTPSVSLVDFSRWRASDNIPKRTTSFPEEDEPAEASPLLPVAKKDSKTTLVMIASVGQEPRLGRWMKFGTKETGARNGVVVAHLQAGEKKVVVEGEGDVSME